MKRRYAMTVLCNRRYWFVLLAGLVCFATSVASAATESAGSVTVGRILISPTSGKILFGVSPVPPHTCNYYNSIQFTFDPTTTKGKNMYALLLEAKALGKVIDVYYEDSAAPGTT